MPATLNRKQRRQQSRQQIPTISGPYLAPIIPTPAWQGEIEEKAIFLPTGKFRASGEPVLRKITLRWIILSKGLTAVKFTVTHITKYEGRGEAKRPIFRSTTVCDHREAATGATGTTGPWNTREPAKSGRARSYTPTAWVTEVTRLCGEEQAWDLLRQAGWDGQRRTDV